MVPLEPVGQRTGFDNLREGAESIFQDKMQGG